MKSEAAAPDASASSHAIKLRALVAAALLVAIMLIILQASPEEREAGTPSGASAFFDHEPSIRVRIGTLEPGQDLVVSGFEGRGSGGVKFVNKGGALEIGGEVCQMPCVMKAARDGDLGIGDRRYHGDLAVVRENGTPRIHLVNRLGIELYLEGVVLSEMPPDYPDEALHAQSIASRSYAACQILARKDKDFDVTDSQRSQVYKGAPSQIALAHRIVAATRGQVLAYADSILEAVFSSTCGGATRSATEAFGSESASPLKGVVCGYCDGTQFSTWSARVKRTDAGRAIGLAGPVLEITDTVSHPSGRLAHLTAHSGSGIKKLTANQFRDLFGVAGRSTWITRIDTTGDWIAVEGRGFGHGVGMCQVGASKLATAGKRCKAILAHYYPDARVGWLYPVHD